MHKGLYQPDQFRDNCGFGLIAHMQGQSSHHLLKTAIDALTCMTHRGGINADGRTGDGCGLLLQMPDQFMRAVARDELGQELPSRYARSEEHTSELQSRPHLVCRLLLEKKKQMTCTNVSHNEPA